VAGLLPQSRKRSPVETQRAIDHLRLGGTAIYLHVTAVELRGAVQANPLAGG